MFTTCGIYKITNITNGKVYVGSSDDIYYRWSQHKANLPRNKHHNPHLQSAWKKYGEANFKWEIIQDCEENDLLKYEQYWMDYYHSADRKFGYNIMPAAGRRKQSEESIRKIIESTTGAKNHFYGKHHTEESRKKMSESLKGRTVWNKGLVGFGKGRKLSEETKKKMSLAQMGKKASEETRKRISEGRVGIRVTEEAKKKISEALKGNKHRLGKYHSKETKIKMSNAHKGQVSWCKGKHLSEEHRRRISENSVGMTGKHHTEETRRKMSESHKGHIPWNKGQIGVQKMSEEAKRQVSLFHKGRKHSEETRKKISDSHKGKKLSAEHIKNMSLSRIGCVPWNKGKKASDEAKRKMSFAQKERRNKEKKQ